MERDDLVARLRTAGCVFAEEEADLLFANTRDPSDLEARIVRREQGEPLEYVVGFAEFDGLRVHLDPGVFIPRRRTEHLVRAAKARAPKNGVIVDLCCGSGALALALHRRAGSAELHAGDIDPVAVACARRNLEPVGGLAHLGDLFDPMPPSLAGRVTSLLANVPYVPTSELDSMPIEAREHEPLATHDGGTDGLNVLRRVLLDAPRWLAPGGHLFVETSAEQSALAAALMDAAGLVATVSTSQNDETVVIGGRPD
ncbi:class I SAM-dependent methyltransferase [Jatrophihabitans fulvus]